MYATVQAANNQANAAVNQEAVEKRLLEKGFNPKKSADMAEVIAARLNGQQLTKIQTGRLRTATDNAVVRDVISDITKKKTDGIDSTQHNGYDEINTTGGDAITEALAPHQDQNTFSEGSSGGGLDTIIQYGKVSIDDIKTNPSAFSGKSTEEIAEVLRNSGYDVVIKSSTRSRSGAQIIQINNPGGGKNISQVQVSPGGGRHGSNPYVKISTTDQGIIKIVDGPESTYVTDGKETATIIFSGGN